MAAPNRVIASGSKYNQLFFYNSDGRLTGSTTTAPATGATGSPAYHIVGWKTGSPTVNEPESEIIDADDTKLGEFTYDSIGERRFTIDIAVNDLELFARLLGTNVQTLAEVKVGVMDIVDAADVNCGFIIQGPAKKYDSGVKGLAGWEGTIVPLAVARPLGRVDYASRTGAVYRLSVTPQTADKDPWGITIQESNAGTSGATYMPFTAENPIAVHTWRGDGSTVDFVTRHVPISAAKTYAIQRIVGGGALLKTVSSVTPGTKLVTVSGAPPQDAELNVLYELSSFVEA